MTEESGVIKSQNYPNEYPNNHECVWTIENLGGSQIELMIQNFDVEDGGCIYDYLEIRHGLTADDNLIGEGKLCGSPTTPYAVTSCSNTLSWTAY